jgi:hypothetical protein
VTSVLSRDDVEDTIWKLLGTRRVDTWKVERLLRMIDQYAIFQARKYVPPSDFPEPPPDPYAYLDPGEFDLEKKVGRCDECGKVRKIPGGFARDAKREAGYRMPCKRCRSVAQPRVVTNPSLELTCRQCGKSKLAEENFYRRESSKTGYDAKCKDCTDHRRSCLVCGERQHIGKFPTPQDRPVCVICRETAPEPVRAVLKKYLCRVCGDRKFVEEFPEEKVTNPQISYACLVCEANPRPRKRSS